MLCRLLIHPLWFPTADEGFGIIQQSAQSTAIILPAGPLLQAGPTIGFSISSVSTTPPPPNQTRSLHKKLRLSSRVNLSPHQQMCTTNLDPPLRSHFLFQGLLLQSFGSDFQLYPLILLTPQRFWLTLEQILHERQLGPEDLQEPLDHQETTSKK